VDERDGPLGEFASGLRRLREQSGGRSYRQMARSANFAAPTLARAASGRRLPSWEVTRAYVAACGGDLDQWRLAWARAARLAGQDGTARPAAGLPVRQLPADLPDFVGRDAEHEFIRQVAQGQAAGGAPRVVVICGPGGVGKTTLAVHAAHRLAAGFADGQLFAELSGHGDQPVAAALAAARFLAALGGPADPAADPIASFRSMAAGRRLLILLDNAASEAQVSPLLPASARCLVIVTSRHALGVLPGARTLRLDVLAAAEAAELLARAAGRDPASQPEAAESLAELCGRLPLALRIAGARLAGGPARSAGWLAARLRDEDHRLRHLAAGSLDLTAVLAESYRPLPGSLRRVFQYAGLFPGSDFTAEALAVLAALPAAETGCSLERLTDSSLVQPAARGRYRMHDLLRLYARQRAETETDPAHRTAAIRRLAAWYLSTVDAADRMIMPARGRPAPAGGQPPGAALTGQQAAAAWYDAEQANLVAVTRAAFRHGHHDIAWRLPVAMRGLLELRGPSAESVTVHQIGLDAARLLGDREGEGWILNGLGTGYWRQEHHREAIDCYRQALAIRSRLADARGVAVVLNNLGSVYGAQGRYDEATDCLRQALAIREQLGDRVDKSFALNSLGHIQHERGRFADALPLLQEALRIRRELGNRNGEAATLHCLGDTLTGIGRRREALACLESALPIFRELGNRYGQAVTLHSMGSTCHALDQPGQARRYLQHAIRLYQDLGCHTEETAATRELAAT
jgi:tetratricopeptide (TPR) repeat protein